MSQQTITARSKPIREPQPGIRQCGYCGIRATTEETGPEYYCRTCKPHARNLGWIPPLPTYTCERCGVERRGTGRTLCKNCNWNLNRVRTPAPKPEPKPLPPAPPCGTKAAHARHKRHGEQPCGPCLKAKAAYDRDWRAGRIGTRKGTA